MVCFRKMLPEDAEAVAKVEEACMEVPWSRESFWREASNKDTYYLVGIDEKKQEIISYAGCWILGDEGHITNVVVSPWYQGQGIGKKMMLRLIEEVKSAGVKAMTLEVRPSNAPALALYKGLGFRSVGRRPGYYTNPKEDAEIMWNTHIDGEMKKDE